jgi:hypothetical protein
MYPSPAFAVELIEESVARRARSSYPRIRSPGAGMEYGQFWGTIIVAIFGRAASSGTGVAGMALAAAVQDEAASHPLECGS